MDEQKMKGDRSFYVKNARHLDGIRPMCHVASAVTSAMFIVVLLLRQDFALPFIQALGNWSYIIAFTAAIVPVVWLEFKVSELIDDFAHSLATLHSWRLAGLMGLIVLPFIILSGSTSFVGSSETAHQGADLFQATQIKELSKSLANNSDALTLEREQSLIEQRKDLRLSIKEKYISQLSKVATTNKSRFKEYKTNDWHFQKLNEYNLRDSQRIEKLMHAELESFDKETTKAVSALMATHNSDKKSKSITTAVLVESGTDAITGKVDRLKWLGSFFGVVVLILLFVSTLAAIGSNFLKTKFAITENELKSSKKKVKSFSNSSYPINKDAAKTNSFEPKTHNNSSYNSHNSGVGDRNQELEMLKNQLRETAKELGKGSGFEQEASLKHSIAIMNKLENLGVVASIGANDGKVTFEKR